MLTRWCTAVLSCIQTRFFVVCAGAESPGRHASAVQVCAAWRLRRRVPVTWSLRSRLLVPLRPPRGCSMQAAASASSLSGKAQAFIIRSDQMGAGPLCSQGTGCAAVLSCHMSSALCLVVIVLRSTHRILLAPCAAFRARSCGTFLLFGFRHMRCREWAASRSVV